MLKKSIDIISVPTEKTYKHNIGHSKFTSKGIPWKIVYAEDYDTLQEAKARELGIKRLKFRKYIENFAP